MCIISPSPLLPSFFVYLYFYLIFSLFHPVFHYAALSFSVPYFHPSFHIIPSFLTVLKISILLFFWFVTSCGSVGKYNVSMEHSASIFRTNTDIYLSLCVAFSFVYLSFSLFVPTFSESYDNSLPI